MSLDLTNEKSTLVQVIAWCRHQAITWTCVVQNLCRLYGFTRPYGLLPVKWLLGIIKLDLHFLSFCNIVNYSLPRQLPYIVDETAACDPGVGDGPRIPDYSGIITLDPQKTSCSTQKYMVRHKNARFDTKILGSTQKCLVRHKNARFDTKNSMHQLPLPSLNNTRLYEIISNFIQIVRF